MANCMELGGVISLVESRGKAPNAPAILKYSKPENSSFWSVLYRASNPKLAKDNFERHDERLQIKREILLPKK